MQNPEVVSSFMINTTPYLIKDSNAIHKQELNELAVVLDPENALTQTILETYFTPCFYSSFSQAVADINADTVGTNAAGTEDTPVVAVYTNHDDKAVAVLLTDATESATVTVSRDMILRLNGKTLTFSSGAMLKWESTVEYGLIDGRIAGSKICKALDETLSNEVLINLRSPNIKVIGGTYQIQVNSSGNNVACCVFIVRSGAVCRFEACSITGSIQAGSANCYGIQNLGGTIQANHCTFDISTYNGNIRAIHNQLGEGVFDNCQFLSAISTGTSSHSITNISLTGGRVCIRHCQLSAFAAAAESFAVSVQNGCFECYDSQIHAKADQLRSYCVYSFPESTVILENSELLADGISGADGGGLAVYCDNCSTTVRNCKVYAPFTALYAEGAGETHITGGVYESSGHGAIYCANLNGRFYAQDATIREVPYKGSYKQAFTSYRGYYCVNALTIGGGEGHSGIHAYFDNCTIDGGGPQLLPDGDDLIGAEPIRFRASSGETDNHIYLSNCHVLGDGKIRFASHTHRLHLGYGNRVKCDSSYPAGHVYSNDIYLEAPELQAEETEA